MKSDFVAKVTIQVKAPIKEVWDALIDPKKIKKYMFGTDVVTSWKENEQIIWKGVWEGNEYQDKGIILKIIPYKYLQYNHFSPLSGVPDKIENYHTLTFELFENNLITKIQLSQDNNNSEDEKKHSEEMYIMMLNGIKKLVENDK